MPYILLNAFSVSHVRRRSTPILSPDLCLSGCHLCGCCYYYCLVLHLCFLPRSGSLLKSQLSKFFAGTTKTLTPFLCAQILFLTTHSIRLIHSFTSHSFSGSWEYGQHHRFVRMNCSKYLRGAENTDNTTPFCSNELFKLFSLRLIHSFTSHSFSGRWEYGQHHTVLFEWIVQTIFGEMRIRTTPPHRFVRMNCSNYFRGDENTDNTTPFCSNELFKLFSGRWEYGQHHTVLFEWIVQTIFGEMRIRTTPHRFVRMNCSNYFRGDENTDNTTPFCSNELFKLFSGRWEYGQHHTVLFDTVLFEWIVQTIFGEMRIRTTPHRFVRMNCSNYFRGDENTDNTTPFCSNELFKLFSGRWEYGQHHTVLFEWIVQTIFGEMRIRTTPHRFVRMNCSNGELRIRTTPHRFVRMNCSNYFRGDENTDNTTPFCSNELFKLFSGSWEYGQHHTVLFEWIVQTIFGEMRIRTTPHRFVRMNCSNYFRGDENTDNTTPFCSNELFKLFSGRWEYGQHHTVLFEWIVQTIFGEMRIRTTPHRFVRMNCSNYFRGDENTDNTTPFCSNELFKLFSGSWEYGQHHTVLFEWIVQTIFGEMRIRTTPHRFVRMNCSNYFPSVIWSRDVLINERRWVKQIPIIAVSQSYRGTLYGNFPSVWC